MLENTNYGKRKKGNSRFVIIAPHAAGDDLKTGYFARCLAKRLNGSFVINTLYKKSGNKHATNPELIEDFNRLCYFPFKQKYLWKRKAPAMKEFYMDIAGFCDSVKEEEKPAVAVYIHGMKNEMVGLDISAGLKHQGKKLFGSKFHSDTGFNTGQITLKINLAKELFRILKTELQEKQNLLTTMGASFSGWSKSSGIQFHKHGGRNDYALQLEINQSLRASKEKIKFTVELLANALEKIFLNKTN